MSMICNLKGEQKEYFLQELFNKEEKKDFEPSHIQFMEDVKKERYLIRFLAKDCNGIEYTLNKNGEVEKNLLPVIKTNNIVEYLEVMEFAGKIIEKLPELIFDEVKLLLKND